MIVVTTLNGRPAAVNAELVERIHENPDTTLVLVDGKRLVVRESMAEVIALVDQAKARVLRLAAHSPEGSLPEDSSPKDCSLPEPHSGERAPGEPDPTASDAEKIGR
ncbi:hypothetical protein NCCP1664_01540 [Zafaria cholistanensis]|uniref:Flagellar protein FlbD n=1 Tax=Zafaria cholistanensis TaxID=1682741 RepID=A0A5A7NNN3_9MICC|nr:flagellar FlbD family protein [Zafaria cholistanensis]GER21657.1 hypothetical protein NCCP1664_01540 [Zafaria cholistanensis]